MGFLPLRGARGRAKSRVVVSPRVLQVGRLLLRKFVCDRMDVPWSEIRLERSPRGKPYLAAPLKGNRVSLKCLWRFNFKAELNFQTALTQCTPGITVPSKQSRDLLLLLSVLGFRFRFHSMISLQAGSSPPHGALKDSHGSFTAHGESLGL